MKKPALVLSLVFLVFSLPALAGGISFLENKSWKEVLALAKQQNKLIFLDAYAEWCGPCKYLQREVFTNSRVGSYYNANFINVKMDMEKGEGVGLSEELGIASYPTLFFINGDGQLVHKTVGAMEADEFIALGKDAINPDKQFYTLRAKIIEGKLPPAAVHSWILSAQAIEEPGLTEITAQYFATTSFPLIEKEMLSLALGTGYGLSKSQIDEIYKSRSRAAELLELPLPQLDDQLLALIINSVKEQYLRNLSPDFAGLQKTITSYYPDRAPLEMQLLRVNYFTDVRYGADAIEALNKLFSDKTLKPSLWQIANSVTHASAVIVEMGKANEFIAKLKAFPIQEQEKDLAYYKDVALLMLYYQMQDQPNVKAYTDKILKNKSVPEALINLVKSL